eukprot:9425080-Prorocentrum_lima.AAC.1
MTSSLVGSEMCIRDRKRSIQDLQDLRGAARGPHCKSLSSPSTPTPTAVSYTHLTLPTICSV